MQSGVTHSLQVYVQTNEADDWNATWKNEGECEERENDGSFSTRFLPRFAQYLLWDKSLILFDFPHSCCGFVGFMTIKDSILNTWD